MKSGKRYKQGHYQHSYQYFEYIEKLDLFKSAIEDFSMDWFNPSKREEELTEKEFLSEIINNYDYQKMIENIS